MLSTGTLNHGGVMVNYRCNAACRHCLYSSSPNRGEAGYVNEDTMEKICHSLRRGGCHSVHIGGGEPFLDFEGLISVIRKLKKAGITLEYIETNAFWTAGSSAAGKAAGEKLKRLLAEGSFALCISLDPYHAEHVPYGAPIALAKLCEKNGMDYFIWKREFFPVLSKLDPEKTHSRSGMENALSKSYIHDTARFYGIGYGGRAVNIEREYGMAASGLYPAEQIVKDKSPCRNLLSTGHFHVDMHSFFIPPRCTGLRLPLAEAVEGIPEGKYPVFEALYHGGISGLSDLARQEGFSPDPSGYPSKCNLCFHARHFLAGKDHAELDLNHYEEALKYY